MYLISYDLASDRIRNKVAKELENYGNRVQYSVFECDLSKPRFKELYSRLCKLAVELEVGEGNIRFYYICGNCEEKILTIGTKNEKAYQKREEVIVI